MSFFKTIVGGTIGFVVGGTIGAAKGAILAQEIDIGYDEILGPAQAFGIAPSKYKICCPHCRNELGVNKFGKYRCSQCGKPFEFTVRGPKMITSAQVKCPKCNVLLNLDGPGLWQCHHCNYEFEFTDEFIIKEISDDNVMYYVFVAFSKFCKVEGAINKDEILAIEYILDDYYELNEELREFGIKYFREGKDLNLAFEECCNKIGMLTNKNIEDDVNFRGNFIECLYIIASKCNKNLSLKHKLIKYTSAILKVDDDFIMSLEENYLNKNYNLKKYYDILGCTIGDSIEQIKKKYKEAAKQYHPDTILNKDIPDYLKEYSNQKFREVKEAYEMILEDLKKCS